MLILSKEAIIRRFNYLIVLLFIFLFIYFIIKSNVSAQISSITPQNSLNNSILQASSSQLNFNEGANNINMTIHVVTTLGTLQVTGTSLTNTLFWNYATTEGYKFGYNFTIPNNAQGNLFINRLREIVFNVSSNNQELIPTDNGFKYLKNVSTNGFVETEEYVVFDFEDIRNSFPIWRPIYNIYSNESNPLIENWTQDVPLPLIIQEQGNNLLLRFNFTNYTFTTGQQSLDPQITINDVNTYSASVKTNITTEAEPSSHITTNMSGLLLYYNFDIEPTANTIYDYTPNNYEGVNTSAKWNSSGMFGGGFDFDGTDDYIRNATTVSVTGLPALTVVFWMYPREYIDGDFDKYVSSGNNAGLRSWRFARDSFGAAERFEFFVSPDGNSPTEDETAFYNTANAPINVWHHFAGTWDALGNTQIYHNGTAVGTTGNQPLGMFSGSAGFCIGSSCDNGGTGGTDDANMVIDEVMVFNRALSAAEIKQIYNNQSIRYSQPANHLFNNVNFTAGDNRINITTNSTLLLNTNISLRLRELEGSTWTANTSWFNITDGNNRLTLFNISTSTNNISLEFDFIPYNGNMTGRFYSPILRENIIIDTWNEAVAPAGDTCTPPGSGTWYIAYHDNCTFTTDDDVPGKLVINGSNGKVVLKANFTFTGVIKNVTIHACSTCNFSIHKGGGFKQILYSLKNLFQHEDD